MLNIGGNVLTHKRPIGWGQGVGLGPLIIFMRVFHWFYKHPWAFMILKFRPTFVNNEVKRHNIGPIVLFAGIAIISSRKNENIEMQNMIGLNCNQVR